MILPAASLYRYTPGERGISLSFSSRVTISLRLGAFARNNPTQRRKGAKTGQAIVRVPLTPPKKRDFDAVGFGLNAVDHLIVVPEYPAFDTKVRFTEYEKSAGGETASAMVALQRLGLRTAYAGRFGSDEDGRFGMRAIDYEGVNLEFSEMIDGAENQ